MNGGLPDIGDEVLASLGGKADPVMELTGYEQDANAGAVSHDHGPRNELGDLPEIQQPGQELQDSDEEGEVDGELERLQSGGMGVAGDRRRRDQADRTGRTED